MYNQKILVKISLRTNIKSNYDQLKRINLDISVNATNIVPIIPLMRHPRTIIKRYISKTRGRIVIKERKEKKKKNKRLTDEQQKEHDVSQRGAQVDPHDPFLSHFHPPSPKTLRQTIPTKTRIEARR